MPAFAIWWQLLSGAGLLTFIMRLAQNIHRDDMLQLV